MSNEDLSKPSLRAASSKDFLVAEPVSLHMKGYLTASLSVMLPFNPYDLGARRTTLSVNILCDSIEGLEGFTPIKPISPRLLMMLSTTVSVSESAT